MNAKELFTEMNQRNFQMRLDGKNLKVRPASELSASELEQLKNLKDDLVLLMSPKCIECWVALDSADNDWICLVGCTDKPKSIGETFDNLLSTLDKEDLEQIIFEFNERIAIIEDGNPTLLIEEVVEIAKRDCISRWKQ